MFARFCQRFGPIAALTPLFSLAQCQNASPHKPDTTRRQAVVQVVEQLQHSFVTVLQALDPQDAPFHPISWLRDEGLHGGGTRYQSPSESLSFKQATVNVSSVHFDDVAKYPIDSATALSVIIHPHHPHAPSMHFHISFMEPKKGKAYWRLIADLNPAIPRAEDEQIFSQAVQQVPHLSKVLYADAKQFGDKYFYIPSLGRHRGTYHFFVGKLDDDELSFDNSCEMAVALANTVISTYATMVNKALREHPLQKIAAEEVTELAAQQIAYHTLYLYQVLTLDRGTTHGVMAHNQNDIGTLGSLPPRINCELLKHWMQTRTPSPQNELLLQVLDIIPSNGAIDDAVRGELAEIVRVHYRSSAEARKNQADLDLKWWAEQTKVRIAAASE